MHPTGLQHLNLYSTHCTQLPPALAAATALEHFTLHGPSTLALTDADVDCLLSLPRLLLQPEGHTHVSGTCSPPEVLERLRAAGARAI
jgi:hypothetical protein